MLSPPPLSRCIPLCEVGTPALFSTLVLPPCSGRLGKNPNALLLPLKLFSAEDFESEKGEILLDSLWASDRERVNVTAATLSAPSGMAE